MYTMAGEAMILRKEPFLHADIIVAKKNSVNERSVVKTFFSYFSFEGIVGVGAALHFMVKPVDKKFFEKPEEIKTK